MSVLLSIVFFAGSVLASWFAIGYATERASNAVTDIVLSNIPAFDVDGVFLFGTLAFIAFVTLLLAAHPKRVPFTLHALTLFYLTRSVFVSLTHIGPFPTGLPPANWGELAGRFVFGSDFFFSGHVGAPFLLALVFWHERGLRAAFLAWAAFMAVVVLLGHYHYSIDVLSAFFISYAIFDLAKWLFPKDRALFFSDVPPEGSA